jgi:hypothetical protein
VKKVSTLIGVVIVVLYYVVTTHNADVKKDRFKTEIDALQHEYHNLENSPDADMSIVTNTQEAALALKKYAKHCDALNDIIRREGIIFEQNNLTLQPLERARNHTEMEVCKVELDLLSYEADPANHFETVDGTFIIVGVDIFKQKQHARVVALEKALAAAKALRASAY